jgi:hypothetical protein
MRRALRVLAVLPYVALTLPFAGTVPIWDAREYACAFVVRPRGR